MTEPRQPPRRVVVTGPRTRSARPNRAARIGRDDKATLDEVSLRALIRSQLRAAIAVCLAVLPLGLLPLLFALVPASRSAELFGVRVPWLVLGGGVYPVLLLIGWLYVRGAERIERDYQDFVEDHST
ncbi:MULTISPECIES: hypothetical protein [unclassified Crossiella]|uniref:hypothetical protein n=1 Tax=unclassified Crossiella TaxID=2620835 RepID=UPI001FFF8489|nr:MULTISPECIES: hypothetical protein [unclassified Crossiella]MCK2243195.1 hypothetical protein [Crossiella sp. S99.2]MCK2254336.1 hypothetical protein [Crossiella sp. S99.1]